VIGWFIVGLGVKPHFDYIRVEMVRSGCISGDAVMATKGADDGDVLVETGIDGGWAEA
jgi:hypothetical protein